MGTCNCTCTSTSLPFHPSHFGSREFFWLGLRSSLVVFKPSQFQRCWVPSTTVSRSHVRTLSFEGQESQCDAGFGLPVMPNVVVFSTGGYGKVPVSQYDAGLDLLVVSNVVVVTMSQCRSWLDLRASRRLYRWINEVCSSIRPALRFLFHIICARDWPSPCSLGEMRQVGHIVADSRASVRSSFFAECGAVRSRRDSTRGVGAGVRVRRLADSRVNIVPQGMWHSVSHLAETVQLGLVPVDVYAGL